MGNVLEMSCPGCGYAEEFLLGAGLRDFDFKAFKNLFGDGKVMEIDEWLAGREPARYNADRQLAFCEGCGKPEVMLVLECFTDSQSKNFYSACASCRSELKPLNREEDVVICPNCNADVVYKDKGRWD